MPLPIITLQNGIKLIHQEINSPIAHFGILVNAGTRDETENKMGLAHFVEHTIFKGTKKRKGYQILKRLENVGGELNACTSKEETYFHASFLSQDYPRVLELLSDIFFNSTFPEKELEKEKDVILEEINYYKDTPSEFIFDEFENVLFDKHPLAMNILGTKKSVKNMGQADIFDFMKRQYTPEHIVLSSVGQIDIHRLQKLCDRYFSAHDFHSGTRERQPFTEYKPQAVRKHKSISQSHIMLGNIAYSIQDDRKNPFLLLTNLLGGQGMSTRLNMAIREKRGLAYSVEANFVPFSDTGLFSIYIGCDHEMIDKCIDLTYKELNKLATQKLGTWQLHYAKKQLIGQMAISSESKLNEMLTNGRSALFFDEADTLEEAIQKVETITAEDILAVANEIFQRDQFSTLIYSGRQ